jgi:mannose-6-phosphate isomerase-like protein (cupin superfamily)
MIIRDLSDAAVAKMARVDLAGVSEEPASAIEPFEFHGCLCGVASVIGRPPWELHTAGDELLHVLSGTTRLTVRQRGVEHARELRAGDVAIVPKGCWHSNDAPDGVTLLYMTPRDGNRHSWDDPGLNAP